MIEPDQIVGDFNIHIDYENDTLELAIADILNSKLITFVMLIYLFCLLSLVIFSVHISTGSKHKTV